MERTYYEYSIARVYEKYSRPVLRFLCCLVRDRQLSEDIMHDAFVKILEKRIRISDDSQTALSYLCKISKNRAIDQLKKLRMESQKYSLMAVREFELCRHVPDDLENMVIEGEVISTLYDTIQSFSDEERAVFLESVFSEKTASRIADEFELSRYEVKRIVKKINYGIKSNLKDYSPGDIFL